MHGGGNGKLGLPGRGIKNDKFRFCILEISCLLFFSFLGAVLEIELKTLKALSRLSHAHFTAGISTC